MQKKKKHSLSLILLTHYIKTKQKKNPKHDNILF